jgi:2-octaprenyl-6-methoxyphenol hydroxylase
MRASDVSRLRYRRPMDRTEPQRQPEPPEPPELCDAPSAAPGPPPADAQPLRIGVVGAGPVGLALALHAARLLPHAQVTVFDARPAEQDVSADPRTLALSLGSVQLLQRLGAWPQAVAQPIRSVHVSQAPPSLPRDACVRLHAHEQGVPMLGAVLAYGPLVAALQRAWLDACAQDDQDRAASGAAPRLFSAFGQAVTGLRNRGASIEVDAAITQAFDLVVVAEGGVYAGPARLAREDTAAGGVRAREPLRHDYGQTAWVGTATLTGMPQGTAFERFTRDGPVALLPLGPARPGEATGPGAARAALVWCVPSADDPVRALDTAQRVAVLGALLPREAGRLVGLSPLKDFPLGLIAERSLASGRLVRIGNAAQTLHPVAGQGLNLGLRDAFALVHALREAPGLDAALRRVVWQRAPDRWTMIATTDFLARSFTWQAPAVAAVRGLALAALQAAPPLKKLLARQMMFGRR